MAFNYSQFVVNLANMLVIPATDPNYLQALPSIIDDAENRIYRELDLLDPPFGDVDADTAVALDAGDGFNDDAL